MWNLRDFGQDSREIWSISNSKVWETSTEMKEISVLTFSCQIIYQNDKFLLYS